MGIDRLSTNSTDPGSAARAVASADAWIDLRRSDVPEVHLVTVLRESVEIRLAYDQRVRGAIHNFGEAHMAATEKYALLVFQL